MNNTLFSVVVFIGILGLLSVAFFGSQFELAQSNINSTTLIGNATLVNTTIIQGASSTTAPPVCQSNGGVFAGIPIISGLADFFGCFVSLVIWFYSFVFLQSAEPWLQILLFGVSAIIAYGIARLIKP